MRRDVKKREINDMLPTYITSPSKKTKGLVPPPTLHALNPKRHSNLMLCLKQTIKRKKI
jgi:hypothetical protein